jgi:hypothetical protein
MLFHFEILGIVAQALLESGVDAAFIPFAPEHEFLAAVIASNPDLHPERCRSHMRGNRSFP